MPPSRLQEYFYPTSVGKVLLGGYQRMGFDLGRPELRAEMERDMDKVVTGAMSKQQCIANSVTMMKKLFVKVWPRGATPRMAPRR